MSDLLPPNINLTDLRKIFLKDLCLTRYIGAYQHEKEHPQRIIFNIDLYVKKTPLKDDALEEVLDYDFIIDTVKSVFEKGHIVLQETLCDLIVEKLLSPAAALAVRVATMKSDVYENCSGIGVEVWHTKF